jgi:hypothetical protein
MVYIGFQRRITYFDCQYNQKLAVAHGLVYIPSRRRTFDIRLKTMFTNIKKEYQVPHPAIDTDTKLRYSHTK